MTTTAKIVTALAVGTAVGVTLGLLFAPAKGSETREKLSQQGQKIKDSFREQFRKAKQEYNDLKEDIKSKAKEAMNDFEEA